MTDGWMPSAAVRPPLDGVLDGVLDGLGEGVVPEEFNFKRLPLDLRAA